MLCVFRDLGFCVGVCLILIEPEGQWPWSPSLLSLSWLLLHHLSSSLLPHLLLPLPSAPVPGSCWNASLPSTPTPNPRGWVFYSRGVCVCVWYW